MKNNKKILAIIPARGGSKRLPKKNILNLSNKPLIAWSIEAALKSRFIDDVVVSSDCEDILKISKTYGAKTLVRPKELASDTATTYSTIEHALITYCDYDYVIILQPTSPLRDSTDIDAAINYLFEMNADSIISVCEVEHSPLWQNTLPSNKSLENFLPPDVINKRSQDLPTYYRLNGALYIYNIQKLLQNKTLFIKKNLFAFIMENEKSIDIDNEIDFKIAEVLMDNKKD